MEILYHCSLHTSHPITLTFLSSSSISWFSHAVEPPIHTTSEGLASTSFFSSLIIIFNFQILNKYHLLLESFFGFVIAHSTPLIKRHFFLFATPTRL